MSRVYCQCHLCSLAHSQIRRLLFVVVVVVVVAVAVAQGTVAVAVAVGYAFELRNSTLRAFRQKENMSVNTPSGRSAGMG